MPDDQPASNVIAAVLVEDAGRLDGAVLMVRLQSHQPSRIVAVGRGAGVAEAADRLDVEWVAGADEIDPATDVSHLWFVRDDCEARPDALAALLTEGDRVEASVAGSKVLDAADRDHLLSIGGATDVFCTPVPLLDDDELDQGQYDVIRDVAYIPSQSVVIRRDAFRGLAGLDRMMAPDAAGIDFSMRARLAGGRVVIVPSSEVFSKELFSAGLAPWREEAGELRAMLKSYSWVSLLWVIPLWLLTRVVTVLGWAVLGRPGAVGNLAKSIAWNLKNAGSLGRERRRVSAARQVGDEELFRFQTSGSHRFGTLRAAVAAAIRRPVERGEEAFERVETGGPAQGAFVWVGLIVAWYFATRGVLAAGLPLGAWTGALADPGDVLSSWAGGWNPAAMGSDGPPHPAAALLAVLGVGLGPSAATWGVALAVLVGIIGAERLGRTLGLGRWPALAGAVVAFAGPVVAAAGTDGGYQFVLGLAALPWVTHHLASPLGKGWRERLGRSARLAIGVAVLVMAVPTALAVPLGMALVLVVLAGRVGPLVLAVLATVLALPALGPWLLWYSPERLLGPDGGFWEPALWLSVPFVGALVLTVVAGERWHAAAVGAVAGSAGFALARGLAPGRDAWVLGMVLASLGMGLVVAGAIDRASRPGRMRVAGVAASVLTIALFVPVVLAFVGGTMGIDEDEDVSDVVGYLAARSVGLQERAFIEDPVHPGAASFEGAGRVLDAADWTFDRAWLGAGGATEAAFHTFVADLVAAPVSRPGAGLAEFGVRWIHTSPGSALDAALSGRLDIYRLLTPEGVVFETVDPAPIAVGTSGPWVIDRAEATGPPSDVVEAAINPSQRWAGTQQGVGVALAGGAGKLEPSSDEVLRLAAFGSAILFLVLGGLALWGRRPVE